MSTYREDNGVQEANGIRLGETYRVWNGWDAKNRPQALTVRVTRLPDPDTNGITHCVNVDTGERVLTTLESFEAI